MTHFFRQYWLTFVGILLGGLGGYLYWYLVGCTTGTCPLQSSPWYMIVWGSAVGGLVFNILNSLLVNRNK